MRMSFLYKVFNNKNKNQSFAGTCKICSISKKNIIAFCLYHADKQNKDTSHVYVSDILTPWFKHKIFSAKSVVSVLSWNNTGELLFVGYKDGSIEIWAPINQQLDRWRRLHNNKYAGEEIVNAKFFHNGKCVLFKSSKKDLIPYGEKFERVPYKPTVSGFGDTHTEGLILVTASGLVAVLLIPKPFVNLELEERFEVKEASQSLGLTRNYISSSCLMHCSNGGMYIAFAGFRESLIHCFRVSIVNNNENVHLNCESLPSVFLKTTEQEKVVRLSWHSTSNENCLFVAFNNNNFKLSRLEQWHLVRKPSSVHKFLQKNKNFIHQEIWSRVSVNHFASPIREVCLSKLVTDNLELHLITRDYVLHLVELRTPTVRRFVENSKLFYSFMTADVTYMNRLVLGFDACGQLLTIQIQHNQADKSYKINPMSFQVALLEYCIITGLDASDILMTSGTNMEGITEKLTENYTRQPTSMRHFFYSNFLALKNKLCRIQSRDHDFDNLILLHCISITFKSLLRPADLSCQDKSPADNLALVLSEPLLDIDKVLLNLDAKDFTVEPVTLQSLQHLMQWVADLALIILHKLPHEVRKSKQHKKLGYDISRDVVALSSIRELLVMIRIWGLLNKQCLPVQRSADNYDVLAVLFRLLTRLTQTNSEPEELLLDECSTLSNQVHIPLQQPVISTSYFNSYLSGAKPPYVFYAGEVPASLQEIQNEEIIFFSNVQDGVYNFNLGCRIGTLRKCARCGFIHTPYQVATTSALRAWSKRWTYCHCGSFWTVV